MGGTCFYRDHKLTHHWRNFCIGYYFFKDFNCGHVLFLNSSFTVYAFHCLNKVVESGQFGSMIKC